MITESKFFKKCLGTFVLIGGCFIIFILVSSIFRGDKLDTENPMGPPNNFWVPTEEDIKYQDSMYNIIIQTQQQLDTVSDGINTILWKLDRLDYPDGSWDSIRYKKDGKIDNRINGNNIQPGDTLEVKATMYHPVEAQCDSDPLVTADGSIIDPYCVSDWNWIAVSRDLLVSGGGCLNYGDSVYVIAGHKTGWYTIHDTMHKRKRNQIDFLESIGTHVYRYKKAELIINS